MRVCFSMKVRSDKLEEYKARHRAVWPEMLKALEESGWHNYSLFSREDGIVIGYLETPDFEQAQIAMQKNPIYVHWKKEMSPFFEPTTNEALTGNLVPLDEVFHLD